MASPKWSQVIRLACLIHGIDSLDLLAIIIKHPYMANEML